ncbi:hypothetical protein NXS19_009067 [Fusarium pseudograminearum]|nr:hypothetical protein NXS19_009067 [Fusarium pseudograminearum]
MIREMEEEDARREKAEEEHRKKREAEKAAAKEQEEKDRAKNTADADRKLREQEREMERLEERRRRSVANRVNHPVQLPRLLSFSLNEAARRPNLPRSSRLPISLLA